jgi:hypothetical protein
MYACVGCLLPCAFWLAYLPIKIGESTSLVEDLMLFFHVNGQIKIPLFDDISDLVHIKK